MAPWLFLTIHLALLLEVFIRKQKPLVSTHRRAAHSPKPGQGGEQELEKSKFSSQQLGLLAVGMAPQPITEAGSPSHLLLPSEGFSVATITMVSQCCFCSAILPIPVGLLKHSWHFRCGEGGKWVGETFLKAPDPGIKGGQMLHFTLFLYNAYSTPGCRAKLKNSGNPERPCLRGGRKF